MSVDFYPSSSPKACTKLIISLSAKTMFFFFRCFLTMRYQLLLPIDFPVLNSSLIIETTFLAESDILSNNSFRAVRLNGSAEREGVVLSTASSDASTKDAVKVIAKRLSLLIWFISARTASHVVSPWLTFDSKIWCSVIVFLQFFNFHSFEHFVF